MDNRFMRTEMLIASDGILKLKESKVLGAQKNSQ